MYTVDIHKYKETVDAALYELKEAIPFGKREKDHVLKVITGYGSKGGTHKIKTAVLAYLEEKIGHGIKGYISGDDLLNHTEKYFRFKYLGLIPQEEKMYPNKGCIYIIV